MKITQRAVTLAATVGSFCLLVGNCIQKGDHCEHCELACRPIIDMTSPRTMRKLQPPTFLAISELPCRTAAMQSASIKGLHLYRSTAFSPLFFPPFFRCGWSRTSSRLGWYISLRSLVLQLPPTGSRIATLIRCLSFLFFPRWILTRRHFLCLTDLRH